MAARQLMTHFAIAEANFAVLHNLPIDMLG
jgi:hypothetical protein